MRKKEKEDVNPIFETQGTMRTEPTITDLKIQIEELDKKIDRLLKRKEE